MRRSVLSGIYVYSLVLGLCMAFVTAPTWGQPPRKKAPRAKAPEFDRQAMEGVFFGDVRQQLQGSPPKASDGKVASPSNAPSAMPGDTASPAMSNEWPQLISASSLEDMIKETKQRLDLVVTNEAKFASGGFKEARREYTFLAMMFGVIEEYPTQVRWKNAAPLFRTKMEKVAMNAKVGSPQAFRDSKDRKQELGDLIGGANPSDPTPIKELSWPDLVDRVPLMQVLEWSLRENLIPYASSPKEIQNHSEEIVRYAETIAAIGTVLNKKGMDGADDAEYVKFSNQMIEQAKAAVQAVKLNSPESAQKAAAMLNQSCDQCHNIYR